MNPIRGIYKLFLWPICRTYARYIIKDRPADAILRFLCALQFLQVHRFWPSFQHPRRFSEKLFSRMLYERNPQFTLLNDKLRVRDYVVEKVGTDYMIPLLWSGENPERIPFDEFPAKFVIKANHGCGYNIIVKDKTQLDKMNTILKLKEWLSENFCQVKYVGIAWGYKNIRPAILVESFIEEDGKAPVDYKFYCFSGRVELVTLHFDRFEEHKTRAFNRDFKPDEFRYNFDQWNGKCKQPQNFKVMVQLAESLAEGFDFMRVDLYSLGDKIYFSELTPYPGGVSTKFLPASRDLALGEKWIKATGIQHPFEKN